MKSLGKIIGKLSPRSDSHASAPDPVQKLLDEGQRARKAESYTQALTLFDEAEHLAEAERDVAALRLISLQRAETLIALERWTDAESLLLRMRRDTQSQGLRAQLSYTLSTLGRMEQARGSWEEARAYYEQALKVAQAGGSLGGEGRAMAHLADTYLEENNASYAVHLLQDALPKLNLSGDIELSSHFVGQLGRGLIETGHELDGEHLLYRALRIAEQMKYRMYERRWASMLAGYAAASMRYEEALRLYRQALPLFKAGDAEQIEALCETSRICLYLGQVEDALDYAERAVTAAQTGSRAYLARGVLGVALRANQRSPEALTHLEFAASGLDSVDDSLSLEILRSLAATKADAGEIDPALAIYQRVLDAASENPVEQAQTHLEMGLLYEQQRNMQAAINQWKAALAIYESEHAYAQAARLYCDIGGVRRYLGQGRRAMREYEQALMMLSSVDDLTTRGVVVSNAAIAYADLGDTESAEAFFTEAIDIASRIGDRPAEATRRGNYGWFLLTTGRPQRAIITLEQALRISQQDQLLLQAAIQTDNLGLAYDALGSHERALEYHRDALAQIEPLNSPHWQHTMAINLGSTLLDLDRPEEVPLLFQQALTGGREQGDAEVIVRALIGQARLALLNGQPVLAGEALEEAIRLARHGNMRRQLAEALQIHSEQQAAMNHVEHSLSLWDEAQKLFNILQMPQAELEPAWLKDHPVEL